MSALWPARSATRRAYAQALAQRNALIARIRAGVAARDSLSTWDRQLAEHGIALMRDRGQALDAIAELVRSARRRAGPGRATPRSATGRDRAPTTPEELVGELAERVDGDLERGFTGHGPHRDDLATLHRGRELRAYGSQGQQRLALLALLLAEREAIASERDAVPLMLLDDVMSELDRDRRDALVEVLRSSTDSR